ncbi:wall-associated receptor kinase 2-like [Oryza brachyantha]|uniref:Protein kinase domain-containing protein n=1 Tax=Oryza brachyantha TaxID=4533 RepID=J3LI65_ORYBR|nr:wall-associated receptor kinase 2-like [Oryza brachyantha]
MSSEIGVDLKAALAMFAVVLLYLGMALAPVTPASAQPSPGCPDKCGNISIPYPFGIGSGCARDSTFQLECNHSSSPPRLLARIDPTSSSLKLHLVGLSLADGEARIYKNAWTKDSPYSDGAFLGREGPFRFSSAKNRLVALGCPNLGLLMDADEMYVTGCMTLCASPSPAAISAAACTGVGCCQTSIPSGLHTYYVNQDKPRNVTLQYYGATESRYVFVADAEWLGSSGAGGGYRGDFNRTGDFAVPVVLDWAIRNSGGNCSAARRNATADFACRADHSVCVDSTNGEGYRCNCSVGYEGNPYINGGCRDINECERRDKYPCFGECTNTPGAYSCRCPRGARGNPLIRGGCVKTNIGLTIGIGVGSGAGLLAMVFGVVFLTRKITNRRVIKLRQKFFKQNRGHLLQQLVSQKADIAERMIIPLAELEKATNNFDESRELGGGGHGIVYKGILSDLHVVAIKKSKVAIQREIDEFINEVAILSQINHRNVVKLFGCCLETEVPLLVYEFISNGTLYHHLHVEGPLSLSWEDRLRIATETARALAYLHSAVSFPIIHRDIKSHNILLDGSLTTKVSDFGASRCISAEQTGVTTVVQGTLGYLDPMYYYTGRLTEKSDVFSFGVVLIELLTRKKPYSYRSTEDDSLVAHFTALLTHGNLGHILDPQITEEGGEEVKEVATLAMACVKLKAEERPTMRQVEMTLESIQSLFLQQEVLHSVARKQSKDNHVPRSYPASEGTSKESTRQYILEEEYLLSSRYPR